MLEAIIRVLAPHYCLGCNKEDVLLCEACRLSSLQRVPQRCYQCKSMSKDCATCKKCQRHGPLQHVWVGCEYTDLPKRLVHQLKFARAQAAHKPIVEQLDDALPFLSDVAVVHVPTATSRVRQRGYDQAALIARGLARNRGFPHISALLRQGQARQVGAVRSVRARQAEEFFCLRPGITLPDRVLLVDDVTTTGATLQAAARCLKRAGVTYIDAVVFTQKQ